MSNRDKYPITAQVIDQFRTEFPGAQVKHSTENGGIGNKRELEFQHIGPHYSKIYYEVKP